MSFGWLISALVFTAATPALTPSNVVAPTPAVQREGRGVELTLIQSRRDGDTPRWSRGVCVGVSGLSAEQSQFMADRVSQRAVQVGLRASRPGCNANVVVVFTNDPQGVARQITQGRDRGGRGRARSQGREELDAFLTGSQPVRWWYLWQSVADSGEIANQNERSGGQRGPDVNVPERGRLGRTTREELTHAYVVIDGPRISTVNMNALADYVAYVALARVTHDATSAGQSSILGLFSDPQPVSALTAWDEQTLRNLYD